MIRACLRRPAEEEFFSGYGPASGITHPAVYNRRGLGPRNDKEMST